MMKWWNFWFIINAKVNNNNKNYLNYKKIVIIFPLGVNVIIVMDFFVCVCVCVMLLIFFTFIHIHLLLFLNFDYFFALSLFSEILILHSFFVTLITNYESRFFQILQFQSLNMKKGRKNNFNLIFFGEKKVEFLFFVVIRLNCVCYSSYCLSIWWWLRVFLTPGNSVEIFVVVFSYFFSSLIFLFTFKFLNFHFNG